jgi:Holliday junction DNA helicase RuvA
MIGKLKGIIDSVESDHAILDVGGVGYIVFCSSRTLSAVGGQGEAAALYIETHVREDHIHLYGFATESEKKWFELLTTVQGVGAKVGLAILSALSPDEIQTAIAAQDKTLITRANGVGPKLAERIVTELKTKIGTIASAPIKISSKSGGTTNKAVSSTRDDAISALTNLGIARIDAFVAVNKVANDDKKLEQIITEALKEVGR